MKKYLCSLVVLWIVLPVFCQKGITFQVEKLPRPQKLLPLESCNDIYENLIRSDADISYYEYKKKQITLPYDIIVRSETADSLVNFGYHPFFSGMYQAYAEHRPFVLSPDMIWLLISQGFARHVNANPEALRPYFVDFEGTRQLIVTSDAVTLSASADKWASLFPRFTEQLAKHTKGDLAELLTADFSTTTPAGKVASQITVMNAMKPYFEFIHIPIICGIPEITLQGTPEDWRKILEKTRRLSHYDLSWWTKELESVLKEFIKASQGSVRKTFWRNMFKCHTTKEYGAPTIIDGWIVRFFPYDKYGNRNNLKELIRPIGGDKLPEEIVKVDLKHIELSAGEPEETMLELWAGFIGVKQDSHTQALTPEIGWMIRKKDTELVGLQQNLLSEGKASWGVPIRVKELPDEFLKIMLKATHFGNLEIQFTDSILIPDQMGALTIDQLKLSGSITQAGIDRLEKMYPNTLLIINKRDIHMDRLSKSVTRLPDTVYMHKADSLLSARLPADFRKAIRFKYVFSHHTGTLGTSSSLLIGAGVRYDFVNKDGQYYTYINGGKLSWHIFKKEPGITFYFNRNGELEKSIDFELMEEVYDLYSKSFLTRKEALAVARKHIKTGKVSGNPLSYYNLKDKTMVWEFEFNQRKKTGGKKVIIQINAETGDVALTKTLNFR